MGPVDGLRLGRGVPPGVEQEAVVGVGEVQPEPARLEADQEDRGGAVLEAPHDRGPVAGAAVEVAVRDALGLQPLADLAEEPGELAEHQSPVPAAGHLLQLAEQRVDLGGRQAGVGIIDQSGVQAQLTQHGQRAENREAVGVHVADQAEDLLPFPLQPRLVGLAVLRMQVDL